MGAQFIDPPPFNLEASYLQSDASTPLIFILSPGADPRLEIQLLADKFGLKNNLEQLSLG
jgi:dynein heavy chain